MFFSLMFTNSNLCFILVSLANLLFFASLNITAQAIFLILVSLYQTSSNNVVTSSFINIYQRT